MAVLGSDITALVRNHLSDFPLDSDPLALTLLNEANYDIQRSVRIYPTQNFNISLVANQQEYDLDASVLRIWRCYWVQDANTRLRIYETSIDQLDYDFPNWINMNPANIATRYYEVGRKLGFVPAPNVTTPGGGYPYVTYNATVITNFTTLGSSLPTFIQGSLVDAWVWGTCARWATMQRRSDVSFFASLATGARNDLIKYVNGVLTRQAPQLNTSYHRVRNL